MNLLNKVWNAINTINKDLKPALTKVDTMDADLYGLMKEVGCMKYSNVELELRLSNLETMVKTLTTGEV